MSKYTFLYCDARLYGSFETMGEVFKVVDTFPLKCSVVSCTEDPETPGEYLLAVRDDIDPQNPRMENGIRVGVFRSMRPDDVPLPIEELPLELAAEVVSLELGE
jgi:hypothetical protein